MWPASSNCVRAYLFGGIVAVVWDIYATRNLRLCGSPTIHSVRSKGEL